METESLDVDRVRTATPITNEFRFQDYAYHLAVVLAMKHCHYVAETQETPI